MTKKSMVMTFVLVLALGIVAESVHPGVTSDSAKPYSDCSAKKSVQTAQTAKSADSATKTGGNWFFLMAGLSGTLSTEVFVTVGPFRNQADCNEINAWAAKRSKTENVSRCWYGN